MTGPARLPALHRGVFTGGLRPPPSASSWQGTVVSPGGAPTQPECAAANRARGRRTGEGPELPGARHRRTFAPNLQRAPPVRPAITTPHESAPQRTR